MAAAYRITVVLKHAYRIMLAEYAENNNIPVATAAASIIMNTLKAANSMPPRAQQIPPPPPENTLETDIDSSPDQLQDAGSLDALSSQALDTLLDAAKK